MDGKQIVVLGQLGTGVRQQAIALAERWHVPFVSVNELESELADTHAESAERAKLLKRRIEQPDMLDGWVLVDFPRSVSQALELEEILMRLERAPVEAAYLEGSKGLLISRVAKETGESAGKIRDRMAEHQKAIDPIVEFYMRDSRLTTINACRSEKEVANELFKLGQQETGAAALIQDEAELDVLLQDDSLLVVDCMASWCGPCKLVSPMVDQLAEAYGDRAKVMKMDFDTNKQIPKRFGLKGMPAVMFFKGGKLKETLTGVKPYKTYSATVSSLLE